MFYVFCGVLPCACSWVRLLCCVRVLGEVLSCVRAWSRLIKVQSATAALSSLSLLCLLPNARVDGRRVGLANQAWGEAGKHDGCVVCG